MFYQFSFSQTIISGFILLTFIFSPAIAHNIKTDKDVGATFHIEPNHNPRAGETNRAWFALTRQGGKQIPLAQCDCQLAVYAQGKAATNSPVLTPALKAISTEQYQGIPGADIVFPQPGIYELKISGSPKSGEDFQPFKLSYTVTVSSGTVLENTTVEELLSNKPNPTVIMPSVQDPRLQFLILAIATGVIISIVGLIIRKR